MVSYALFSMGQEIDMPVKRVPVSSHGIEFVPNNGQWKENIQMRADIPFGNLYFENDKLTFVFYSEEDIDRIHDVHHGLIKDRTEDDKYTDGHLFQISYPGSNPGAEFSGKRKKENYNNYFLGRNRKYWASKVPVYREAYAKDFWEGVDYRVYSNDRDLKYDFIVKPGADANQISMRFHHLDDIYLKHENLYLITSVNELVDLKPVAFQERNGQYEAIACNYVLEEDVLRFDFPEGFNNKKALIIDPQLIFSTYSGSTQDNWGFTATYDNSGNYYGGGIAFNDTAKSYPTTAGAFRTTQYTGGAGCDVVITKFNSTGTSLIYSTYLGGLQKELPHSMVVDSKGELIVMGSTCSQDFPVTPTAYDTTYNRTGTATKTIYFSMVYQGSDLFLTKFSADGSSLIGSTFIGGGSFDGLNENLEYNYGDVARGEVVVDQSDRVYVASTTESTDFPVTNSSSHGGGVQDAVIFSMDSTFSNLLFSTYLGGSGNDAAYSIQPRGNGNVVVAGGTNSSNFTTTSGALNTSARGGIDGFVTIMNTNGSGVLASTYLGTSNYDQAYFVQLDGQNNVYVAGQTTGNYPVSPNTVYSNPNSSQFIHKLKPFLDSTIISTVIGNGGSSGNVTVDISPSAFLVNECDHIYLSGWGGSTNSQNSSATGSTTNGLPITTGAYKTTTDGNDFYLIVLSEDADSLLYATFFGRNGGTGDHVDGGTSRFDKKGIVYQAVCAGCGGSNAFPTAPSNVWSTTNGSSNCNFGAIKFDLSQLTSVIEMDAVTKVCIPGTVNFVNGSNGGTGFSWDFGDGFGSSQYQPSHTYNDTGEFTVRLIVYDSLSCVFQDTAYIKIRGEAPPAADVDTVPVICPGDSIMLQARGGIVYNWSPSTGLSNDTIANPWAGPLSNTTYTIVVGDSCGSDTSSLIRYDTAWVDVTLAPNNTAASPDDTICKGSSTTLFASGGNTYRWRPSTYLNNPFLPNPTSTPLKDIEYTVEITDDYSCDWEQKVFLHVEDPENPDISITPDTTICIGDSLTLYVAGGARYSWSPGILTADSNASNTMAGPLNDTRFVATVFSKCYSTTDTVFVWVNDFKTNAMPDTFACPDVPLTLRASPGQRFVWEPKDLLDSGSTNKVRLKQASFFYVTAWDSMNCMDQDTVFVELRDPPYVTAGNDQTIYTPVTSLEARGNGNDFRWSPENGIECPTCPFTGVEVLKGDNYYEVTITDRYGCKNTDGVIITRLENNLFIPNSFTPNSDGINDVFRPYGFDLVDYEIYIYNRWGEIIFYSTDLETGWDGMVEEGEAGNGVYVYEVIYSQNGQSFNKKGTVSLLR